MEITLKNFRCWEQKTIHLAPEGITLLSGPSGVGKSSILEAILFAVTGKGRNIIMQGKSGCSVKFVLNDGTVITRRKRPNIVTLKIAGGKMYEDDAAEGIIREKFTTNFETLGYLGQNGKNTSFVLKGPADKLAFIEQLAFNSINIVELKNKAYELYKNEDNMFTTSTTKEDVLIQQVDECNDISKISFPIKTDGSKESHVSVETKMKDNLVKVSDDIDKVKKKIECFTTMLRKYEHLNDKITNIIKLENNSKKEIKEVEENLSLIDEKVDDELENTKKQLENMRRQRKAIELNNKINENKENLTKLKENEISEMRTKYENIDTWNNGTMEETERDIEEIETEREGILDTLKIQTKLEKLSFDPEILIKKELTRKKNEE
ncbi:MAG TPA: hypothetical protein EYO58_02270, partial [Flavobacteriales bacterium]|nr:hypothetical protein [Flavobacteriales bacterium]